MFADIIEFDFLRYTFLTGILIGLIGPLLGSFIVVRRLSLIADALSHVALGGIAFGLLLEKKLSLNFITPFYGGMIFSVLGSILIEKLRGIYKSFQELAIPIILSGGVGLSVIFISLANGFNTDLFSYLFGSVSAVSRTDFYTILGITVFIVVTVLVFYKELFSLSFDEEFAKTSGLHVKRIHFLFIILIALVIATSIRIVGVLLVSSLMTLPVAAAMRIAKGFKQMVILSIVFGEVSVLLGLASGYYLNIPPGGTIVVVAIIILLFAIFCKALLHSKNRGGLPNE